MFSSSSIQELICEAVLFRAAKEPLFYRTLIRSEQVVVEYVERQGTDRVRTKRARLLLDLASPRTDQDRECGAVCISLGGLVENFMKNMCCLFHNISICCGGG